MLHASRRDKKPHIKARSGITRRLIQVSVVHPMCMYWYKLRAISAATVADVAIQSTQLHVGPITFPRGKSRDANIFISEGRIISVPTPEITIIEAKKIPTVLYGTNVAANKGKKPIVITITLRVIARAGSPKMDSEVSAQELCSRYILFERERK